MDGTLLATAVVLRELKCYSIETIDARILLQKKVYLAQDIGLPLGYSYSWYIHGPYSTDLTAAAYKIIPEGIDSIADKEINGKYKNIIEKVNALVANAGDLLDQISVVQWYELLASVSYWYRRGYKLNQNLSEQIMRYKPQFSKEHVAWAIDAYFKFKEVEL